MTAGTAATTIQAAPCPKSALTRLARLRPPERCPAHRVPARQRGFCPSRRLRHASGFPDAADDPVNESDPSGESSYTAFGVPSDTVRTYRAMNRFRNGYHNVYLTQGAFNHMTNHILQWAGIVANFVGQPLAIVEGQAFEAFLTGIGTTLSTPQPGNGIRLQTSKASGGGLNVSLLYQAPYAIYNEATSASRTVQFFVGVGYPDNVIYTAYVSTKASKIGKTSSLTEALTYASCGMPVEESIS